MCVDIDLDAEDNGLANRASHDQNANIDVAQILESEVHAAKMQGNGTLTWLELDELGIDDDMLATLRLSDRFPVG